MKQLAAVQEEDAEEMNNKQKLNEVMRQNIADSKNEGSR